MAGAVASVATVGPAERVEMPDPVAPVETVETEVAPGLAELVVAVARHQQLVAARPVVRAALVEQQAMPAQEDPPAGEVDYQEPRESPELRQVAAQAVAAALPTAPARELSLQPAELVGPEDLVHQVAQVAPVVTPK